MPINIFVNEKDTIPIAVWAYKRGEIIEVVDEEKEIPKEIPDKERQHIEMEFRRPSYSDSLSILEGIDIAEIIPGARSMVIQDRILRALLVGWNIQAGDKKAEINDENINLLNTDIIRSILLRLSAIIGL